MKKQFLSLAAGVFLLFSARALAAPQADSCLKMISTNDYDYDTNQKGWQNPDSLRIDSCVTSATYLEIYSFRYFHINFNIGNYPFDSIIRLNEVKYSSDISSKFQDFKNDIINLENKYGKIYFTRDGVIYTDLPDSSYIYSPRVGFYLESYANVKQLKEDFKKITFVNTFLSLASSGRPASIVDEQAVNLQSPSFTPNPVKSKLTLLFDRTDDGQKIKISNLMGILVKEIDFSKEIDVSELSSGIYFLQTNDKEFKFIKE